CESNEDGTLTLHYISPRKGLYPIVIGVVKAVGRELFNIDCTIEVIDRLGEQTNTNNVGMAAQDHVIFRVTENKNSLTTTTTTTTSKTTAAKETSTPNGATNGTSVIAESKDFSPHFPDSLHIDPRNFCTAFPFHIIFDRELCVLQSGTGIQRLCPEIRAAGSSLRENFVLEHPLINMTWDNIVMFINAVFVFSVKQTRMPLKGQIVLLNLDAMLFICSPRLTNLNELMDKQFYLSDIPIYDVTRELILLNQQREAEIEVSKKLDETTAELKRTSLALEREKQRTEFLLHQMLPKKVADQLKQGKSVDAEKFDEVTILFSDIVTFTNIAAACQPIDIVHMLNNLYAKFDASTTKNNVYKVETIGDAYMVVSGVPEVVKDHAECVCDQALDMVTAASEVKSPATGRALQIRVGMHSGPVVAGVVGLKMPRYCLFGDTVNTASRMESHGIPGKIHLSPDTYRALMRKGAACRYQFQPRGALNVKGKGVMHTHFLVGKDEKRPDLVVDESDAQYQRLDPEDTPSMKQTSEQSAAASVKGGSGANGNSDVTSVPVTQQSQLDVKESIKTSQSQESSPNGCCSSNDNCTVVREPIRGRSATCQLM
ncbi:guanylate cyclase soluble subunit beta-2, partial [Lingula anatina]|uniref:guanylate cyclase n=1 Tax=Lingula anatina TaxID=7574 RepID=A0A1S3IL06_LINAN